MTTSSTRVVRSGFTLVELLVVIAIIAILIGLLFPAVQAIRATARNMHCRNNLRQMSIAATSYESSHGFLPPGAVHNDDDFRTGQHSGFVYLLPHLEQRNLFESYDTTIDWNQGSNLSIIATRVKVFECPASDSFVQQNGGVEGGATDYAMCKGDSAFLCWNGQNPRGAFDINSKTQTTEIRDGLSQTIFFGEAASDPSIEAVFT